jgi:hypothetical protein
VIGVPDEPNVFEDNAFADIYVLDTRPANAIEIATSNEFRGDGTTARVRQDWFGAIRVLSRTITTGNQDRAGTRTHTPSPGAWSVDLHWGERCSRKCTCSLHSPCNLR